jgi:hypothetical protein
MVRNAVLEVVKAAPPWYSMRDSRVIEEAHTRRRNGRHDGGRRERRRRWHRFRCLRGRWRHGPCADARAAMERTTKSRCECSSSTPPVAPVRRELPCSAVHPSVQRCVIQPGRCTATCKCTRTCMRTHELPRACREATVQPSTISVQRLSMRLAIVRTETERIAETDRPQ